MVGEKELHDSSPGHSGGLRSCIDSHGRCNLGAARGDGFRGLFHLYQAHPAIASDFESFVVAKSGNLDTILFGSLEDGEIVIDLSWERGVPGRVCH